MYFPTIVGRDTCESGIKFPGFGFAAYLYQVFDVYSAEISFLMLNML